MRGPTKQLQTHRRIIVLRFFLFSFLLISSSGLMCGEVIAQSTDLSPGFNFGTISGRGTETNIMQTNLSADLELNRSLAEFSGAVSLRSYRHGQWINDSKWSATLLTSHDDGWHGELSYDEARTATTDSVRIGHSGNRSGKGRLVWQRDERQVWLSSRIGQARSTEGWLPLSQFGIGGGRNIGNANILFSIFSTSFQSSSRVDSIPVYPDRRDTLGAMTDGVAGQSEHASYTDMELGLGWSNQHLDLNVVGGLRFGEAGYENQGWFQCKGAWWLSNHLALVAAGGIRPSIPEEGLGAQKITSLAMRFDLLGRGIKTMRRATRPEAQMNQPTRFAVHPVRGDVYRFQLQVPDANKVEIAGDFSNWEPVVLRKTAPDIWQTKMPIQPGTHRISIRLDQREWRTPPGLVAQDDEFGRSVGMFYLR